MKVLIHAVLFSLLALACGDDGDSNGGPTANGPCSRDEAATACGNDCRFAPSEISCAQACANIATVCAEGSCGAQCAGLNQDVALCTAACEGSKQLSCPNVTFGCYATSSNCSAVGSCVVGKL